MNLASSTPVLSELSGTLTRRKGEAGTKYLDGTLNAVFAADSKRRAIRTIATLETPDRLSLRFSDWPTFGRNGKLLGEKVYSEALTRSGDSQDGDASKPLRGKRPFPRPRFSPAST